MSNAYWEALDFELPPAPKTAALRLAALDRHGAGIARGHRGSACGAAGAGDAIPRRAAFGRGAARADRRLRCAGMRGRKRRRSEFRDRIVGPSTRIRRGAPPRCAPPGALLRRRPKVALPALARRLAMVPVGADTRRNDACRMRYRSQNLLYGGRGGRGGHPEHAGRPRFRRRAAGEFHKGRLSQSCSRREPRGSTGLPGPVGRRRRRRVRSRRAQRMDEIGDPARIHDRIGSEHRRADCALCFPGPRL